MNPAAHGGERCPVVATYDCVEAALDEADKQGMHVMLGLGRSGDVYFSLALEDYYLLARDGIPNQIDPVLLNTRLATIVMVSQHIADDLWRRYRHHHSLYGWILSHELTCYDVATNLYTSVAATVKHRTLPDRPVLVAPYAPRNCLAPEATIPRFIQESP